VTRWRFLSPGFSTFAATPSAPVTFDAANKLYYEGRFPDAASAYEKLIKSGQTSAVLYFNLGNALFKSGQIGRAIDAYRKAEQITPRDPDVRANLRFAQNQVQGPTLPSNRVEDWLRKLTLNEWAMMAAVAVWLFFLLLIVLQVRPTSKQTLRPYLVLSLLTVVVLSVCLALSFYNQRMVRTAVVTIPDAIVRQGPLEASPNAFPVHDGAQLRILNDRGDWLQVSPDPSRIGWIRRDQVIISS